MEILTKLTKKYKIDIFNHFVFKIHTSKYIKKNNILIQSNGFSSVYSDSKIIPPCRRTVHNLHFI